MDVRLLIVFDFFFLSFNCPFFLIFSFSSLVAIRNNSKKTPSQSRIRGSLNVTGLCSANWDYDMMFREKLLEMEFLAVAFYEMAFFEKERHFYPHQCTWADVFSVWSARWCQKEWGRPTALSAFLLQYTWYVEGSWTTDLSGVFSSASNWVISSVLSPLRKGFVDLFVLAAALVSTSESSISWIPRSPRRKPSNTNGSSSHFRTGVGRELPLALKISLSNNFHIKCISYPSLLLPELAKPVFNPDSFKMFRFFHPALIVCLISSAAWFRLSVQSKHTS